MKISKKMASLAMTAAIVGGASATALSPAIASAADAASTNATASGPGAWIKSALSGLVSDGTITQDQADKVATAVESARPEGGRSGFGHGSRGASFSTAAQALNISEADLRSALGADKSIADVAKAKGIDVQKVIDALVAERNASIDDRVANGGLTQEEADAKKATVSEQVTNFVNSVLPPRGGKGSRDGEPAPGTTEAPAA